ncbi:hypothetical protein HMI54_012703 [Coelomomyces lativittatus]|nr:hypothetical protein HMI56_003238 [Coelomomyces lativittatus]KAJ1515208.1 hypothetical protein HMI54_012703 [Coelomomyces lativittatus]KAJ1517914.1 hypothetical protein HMI55_004910 [Coelomomyces lativittatus]
MFTCRDCGAGVNDPEAHFCNVASRKSKKIIDLPPSSTPLYQNDNAYFPNSGDDDTLQYPLGSTKTDSSRTDSWDNTERLTTPKKYTNDYRQEVESYVSSATYSSTKSDSRGPASMHLHSSPQPSNPATSPNSATKGYGLDFLTNSYNKLFKGSTPSKEPTPTQPPATALEPSEQKYMPASSSSNRISRARPLSILPTKTEGTHLMPLSDIMVFRDNKSVLCTECRNVFQHEEEFVKVGRAFYHTTCCACTQCRLTVDEDQYGSDGWFKDGQRILCGDCMEQNGDQTMYDLPLCDTCREPMSEGTSLTHPKLPGIHHASCLTCQKCKRRMSECLSETNPMHVKNGRPICHQCGASHCSGCKRVIERNSRVCAALGKKYHVACFQCLRCGAPFPDKSFYVFENEPHCQMCYHIVNDSLCRGCETPIEGPCVSVLEGRFHPECFSCVTCGELLTGVYYAFDNQSYCEHHIRELQRSIKGAKKAERRQTHFEKI